MGTKKEEARGDLLARLMRERYLTQVELAKRSGVSITTIRKYLRGENARRDQIRDVAAVFGTDGHRIVEAWGFPGLLTDDLLDATEAAAKALSNGHVPSDQLRSALDAAIEALQRFRETLGGRDGLLCF